MQPLIELHHLEKVYGTGEIAVHALRDADLTIQRGEFVAIMGASGSGKSTLMSILGGLDQPTAGTYELDRQHVSGLSRNELAHVRNEKMGFVFQSFNLLPRLTALKNVMLPMSYSREHRFPYEEREKRAIAALETVGLGDRLTHKPSELSGGQQQRVAIARALVMEPPLILADEPTGNLDSQSSAEIMEIFHRLHAQGVTIVMVTHAPEIAAHADRVIRVQDGRTVAEEHDAARHAERIMAGEVA